MEKFLQKHLLLLKTASGKGGEFWNGFQKMPTEPMKGVKIESSYSLFGYWDFAIFFKPTATRTPCTLLAKKCVPSTESPKQAQRQ